MLPTDEYRQLAAQLDPVRLGAREILYAAGQPIADVYFPRSGVCSMLAIMESGASVEVATIGREGMLGLQLFLGAESAPFQTYSQIAGEAFRMSAADFWTAVGRSETLRAVLLRYAQAQFIQTAQSAACNRLHPVEERCARWLLMTHDRVAADRFALTHEYLSQMLGVRRSSVTVAAGMLQQAGLIAYAYGTITIVDRGGLEMVACECYRLITDEVERLLSPP